MNGKPLRHGIVGTGFMADVHTRAVRRGGGVVTLVAGSTPGDQHGIYCSNDLISRELGWSPRVGVRTGLAAMVAWALAERSQESVRKDRA